MDNTKEYIRHLSLCSGYEGIGLGLRRVLPDVREVAHVEIEAFAIANLVAKMEAGEVHPAPVFSNLKEFPFRKFRGCVDIMSGGFPCQPFSGAGKQQSTEDPRHLFPYILEGIRECQPAVVFLENVEGIISSKTDEGESVLKYVLQSLEEVGYRATAGVFSASEVGAPHQRKRVFIMAHRKDFRCGRGKDRDGADRQGLQESEEDKQSMVRSQAEGCSGDMGELGYTKHDGWVASTFRGILEEASTNNKEGQKEASESSGTGGSQSCGNIQASKLADSDSERPQRIRSDSYTEGREGQVERPLGLCNRASAWPARPKEDQHEWEEPRVVHSVQALTKLGGTTDGDPRRVDATANRVDRLRLLGNGVVPHVASKAFVVLSRRLI